MKICDLTTEKEAKKHNSCERYSNETRQTFTNYVAQHHLTNNVPQKVPFIDNKISVL